MIKEELDFGFIWLNGPLDLITGSRSTGQDVTDFFFLNPREVSADPSQISQLLVCKHPLVT